ncbi:MOSC domain-containing protein [Litoreibacter sp.]|nr:MOSC domain-containing protein [Litoreibacter sp.]
MSDLRTLMRSHPRNGSVDWIGLRPARLAPVNVVEQAEVTEFGLAGDHYTSGGTRAVTLIQAEHLPVIAALTHTQIMPEMLRRNIVISGINLYALRHDILQIGTAQLKLTKPCAPCSRMEKTIGPGGYNAMRGHSGWYAEIITPGHFNAKDALTVASAS